MKFVELSAEDFRKFAAKSPYKSFYQTPEIAKLREQNGWTVYYFGVAEAEEPSSEDHKLGRAPLSVSEEDGFSASACKLVAAAMIVARPTFLGKSTFYCPGGPLIDYENTSLVNFFFKNLNAYIKSHNGYVLHIEPYYELIERDRDGLPKENGFNHQKTIKNLISLGFKKLPDSDEPQYSFALELKNRSAEQIFVEMKRNTRNHIRKAEKMGVKIRELKREELGVFKQITESTSRRRNFEDKPLSYYEKMYDLFTPRGEVKFLVAEAKEKKPSESAISQHCAGAHSHFDNGHGRDGAGVAETTFSRDNGRLARSEAYIPDATEKAARRADFPGSPAYDAEGEIVGPEKSGSDRTPAPLSAAMFMLYGDEIIYLFSGSDEKYMKDYNAQYLIQWHMIKYAIDHKYERYNFYGINGLPDKNSKDYGIYDFKKGFTSEETGRVIELLGAYELPIKTPFYYLHIFLSNLKNLAKTRSFSEKS